MPSRIALPTAAAASVVAVVGLLVAHWSLSDVLARASGKTDQPGPSVVFDWRWLPLWLLPKLVLLTGLAVAVVRWRRGGRFQCSWGYTLGLAYASLVLFWLLYGITNQRVVRGIPPQVEDWTSQIRR